MSDLEQRLLFAALASRPAYEQLAVLLDDEVLSEAADFLLKLVGVYYGRDRQAQHVDRVLFVRGIDNVCGNPKTAESMRDALGSVPVSGSVENVVNLYREAHARALRFRLVDAMLAGNGEENDLLRQYQEARASRGADEHQKTQLGIADLFDSQRHAKIRVYPGELNTRLRGGMRPGMCGLIFGRPGAGKTLLTVNNVAGNAKDGHRVLYIGNEESQQMLTYRFLSRMSLVTLAELDDPDESVSKRNVARAIEKATPYGWENVHIVHGVTDLADAQQWIERIEPRILILDQVRHMSGGGDGLTQNLELVTRWLREVSHKYSMVGWGVSQAGGTAEGKSILDLNDFDSSKTGAQGACDLMLGIGVTDAERTNRTRWVSICRNKVSGVVEPFHVRVDEQTTRVLEDKLP